MDPADYASLEIEIQLQAALHRHVAQQPKHRSRSIHCIECGSEIPDQRRELLPHVNTCVYCAEARELRRYLNGEARALHHRARV